MERHQTESESFGLEREAWLCLLPRALALAVTLLAMLFASPTPAMEPALGIQVDQASAARRFGRAQADQVNGRLRLLHASDAPCLDRFDIGTNIRWERAPSVQGGRPLQPASLGLRCNRPFAAWADGDVDFGFLRPSVAGDRSGFRTSGLTLGADTRLREGAIVGAAIGYGRHDTDVDAEGSESRAHGQTLTLYGAFEPVKALDIDASIGVGDLSFDANRSQPADGAVLSGDRAGSQVFASLAFRADLVAPNVRVVPYARYDVVRNQLDAYGERGSATALDYERMATAEETLAVGVQADLTFTLASATIAPMLRVEQRRVRSVGFDQVIACAEFPPVGYSLCQGSDLDASFAASLAVPVRLGAAASIAFEYSYASGSDALRAESVRARLHAPF